MRRLAPAGARLWPGLVVILALVVAPLGSARADPAPVPPGTPAADPPTPGALTTEGQDGRWLLGGTWLRQPDPGDQGLGAGWWQEGGSSAGWTPVSIPDSFNAGDFSSASMNGSVTWYRRDFTLPANAFPAYVAPGDQRWIVRFESVNYSATVWLNGQELGTHTGAYLPFELTLAGLHPGVNELVVRVDDRRSPTDLPPGPGGGWWNFGGIQREVYLRAVAGVDVSQAQIRPLLPCARCAAAVDERALVRNLTDHPVRVELGGSFGTLPLGFGSRTIPAGGSWSAHDVIALAHPLLWSPDHPHLYRARLLLQDAGGRPLGGYTALSGVRNITVGPSGGLRINGRLVHLRGVDLHEQDLASGAALSPAAVSRMMGWVRSLGAGIVRAHYPLSPQFVEMADRNGVLLWSEIPVYQLSAQALANPATIALAHRMLAGDIATNQNHPSVLLWSIANELPTPSPPAETAYIAGAAALAHALDPTRPVGMAVSAWPGVPCQDAYAPLDVIGFNEYFGWFDAGAGATDDREQLGPYLQSFHDCYPGQAVMVSEFGFDANRDGPPEERGTYAFQADAIRYHMGVFASLPWLAGAIYWSLQDFAARPGWSGGNPRGTPPFVQKGVVGLDGSAKPNFNLLGALIHAVRQIDPPAPQARPSGRARARHRPRAARARGR